MNYTIEVVETKLQLREFLKLPTEIYKQGSLYVAPLRLHLKMMMGKLKTAEKAFLIARHQGQVVARVGFKKHKHGDKEYLHFGFYESLPDHSQATTQLFQQGRKLFPHLPLKGPFHFRLEDPYTGLLVDGFDRAPYFLMPYNPPYYNSNLELAGLTLAMDLYTYEIDKNATKSVTETVQKHAQKAKDLGVQIRFPNPKKLKEEARAIAGIFNDALSKNWGYEEFLEDQVNEMVLLFKFFVDLRVVSIATYKGEDVGCLIMLPNYNPILKTKTGRITPALLYRFFTQKKKIHELRGYALGVKKAYHSMGIGSLLTASIFEVHNKFGYDSGEISWILANNGPMNELSVAMGGKHNKVYRIFQGSA